MKPGGQFTSASAFQEHRNPLKALSTVNIMLTLWKLQRGQTRAFRFQPPRPEDFGFALECGVPP